MPCAASRCAVEPGLSRTAPPAPCLSARLRSAAGKRRRGAPHPPATPCQRLMADARTSEAVRRRLETLCATLDPVRLLQEIRAAQQQLVGLADAPVRQRSDPAYRANAGAVSLRAANRVERRRGSSDQRTKAEAQALAAPARSVRGGHDHAAGMVRGGTVAHIARIVRAAAGGVSRCVSGRAAANMPKASQGMAARGCPSIGIRDRDGRRHWCRQQERMPGGGVGGRQYPVDLPLRLDDPCALPTTPPGPQQQASSFKGKEDLRRSPLSIGASGNGSILDEATVACWVTFCGEAIRLPILIAALHRSARQSPHSKRIRNQKHRKRRNARPNGWLHMPVIATNVEIALRSRGGPWMAPARRPGERLC